MGICKSKPLETPAPTTTAAPPVTATPPPFSQTEFAKLPLDTFLTSESDDRHKRFKQWCKALPSSRGAPGLLDMVECAEAVGKRGNLYLQGKRLGDDEDVSKDRLAANARPIVEKYLTVGSPKRILGYIDGQEEGVKGVVWGEVDLADPKVFDGVVRGIVKRVGEITQADG
ncbi:hypothetical protein HK104_009954 [Borealophlyctis nickersoniae]|nr:hypothetical protein HK104_009954 [Borealophlyctis nickersoniae]